MKELSVESEVYIPLMFEQPRGLIYLPHNLNDRMLVKSVVQHDL